MAIFHAKYAWILPIASLSKNPMCFDQIPIYDHKIPWHFQRWSLLDYLVSPRGIPQMAVLCCFPYEQLDNSPMDGTVFSKSSDGFAAMRQTSIFQAQGESEFFLSQRRRGAQDSQDA